MFKQGGTSNRWKIKGCLFQQAKRQRANWFLTNTEKCSFAEVSF